MKLSDYFEKDELRYEFPLEGKGTKKLTLWEIIREGQEDFNSTRKTLVKPPGRTKLFDRLCVILNERISKFLAAAPDIKAKKFHFKYLLGINEDPKILSLVINLINAVYNTGIDPKVSEEDFFENDFQKFLTDLEKIIVWDPEIKNFYDDRVQFLFLWLSPKATCSYFSSERQFQRKSFLGFYTSLGLVDTHKAENNTEDKIDALEDKYKKCINEENRFPQIIKMKIMEPIKAVPEKSEIIVKEDSPLKIKEIAWENYRKDFSAICEIVAFNSSDKTLSLTSFELKIFSFKAEIILGKNIFPTQEFEIDLGYAVGNNIKVSVLNEVPAKGTQAYRLKFIDSTRLENEFKEWEFSLYLNGQGFDHLFLGKHRIELPWDTNIRPFAPQE